MGWRGYVDNDRRAVFFWSQKAACTSLFGFLSDNMAKPPEKKIYFHQASQPFHVCRPLVVDEGYRSVILVRHPTLRTISAFFNKFCVYRGRPLRRRPFLEPFARDLHDLYCDRTGADPVWNTMSFEDYLDTVEALFERRPGPDTPVNGHWETQVPPMIRRDPAFRYDHVVHVERLGTEMRGLAGALGMRYAEKTENRTPVAETAPHDGYLGDVEARRINEYAFGYENFLTDATIDRIAQLYARDFETFGYDPDPRVPGGPLGPPKPTTRLRDRLGALLTRDRPARHRPPSRRSR
ncbi:sulfotransferase family 2 domain-containing protein [Roseivivax sediminis]|uniref:Sulfotransferase family protein n=1 Tax=Roseivivax sediminis TaxID=936889 RepID=A0A1I2ACD4_9RHOB|nr:sulfotransferase family 2 domain-containing protein [Roseivivax sediminis]SFE41684.1 Sulfotransferase family protein [Roseivivax sediminis]